MKLGDRKIRKELHSGNIAIEPFDDSQLGGNSYDVRLSKTLATYKDEELDCRRAHDVEYFDIPLGGYVIRPGQLYLGSTVEHIGSDKYLSCLEGKSSLGRLGVFIHVTAGLVDTGFFGNLTLEIMCIKPIRIYAGMPIGQLTWEKTTKVKQLYSNKPSAKYSNQESRPVPSAMWRNFRLTGR